MYYDVRVCYNLAFLYARPKMRVIAKACVEVRVLSTHKSNCTGMTKKKLILVHERVTQNFSRSVSFLQECTIIRESKQKIICKTLCILA